MVKGHVSFTGKPGLARMVYRKDPRYSFIFFNSDPNIYIKRFINSTFIL